MTHTTGDARMITRYTPTPYTAGPKICINFAIDTEGSWVHISDHLAAIAAKDAEIARLRESADITHGLCRGMPWYAVDSLGMANFYLSRPEVAFGKYWASSGGPYELGAGFADPTGWTESLRRYDVMARAWVKVPQQ